MVCFPPPLSDRNGTSLRTRALLRFLAPRHKVTLLTCTDLPLREVKQAMDGMTLDLILVPPDPEAVPKPGMAALFGRWAKVFRERMPPNLLAYRNAAFQKTLDELVASGTFDILTAEHAVNAIFVRPEYQERLPTVVDIHSVSSAWLAHDLATRSSRTPFKDRLLVPVWQRYEREFARKFSTLVVTTPDDVHHLSALCPGRDISVVSHGVDVREIAFRKAEPENAKIVFLGVLDAPHNVNAAVILGKHLFPRIKREVPEARLVLLGANPSPEVKALSTIPGISITGPVPDVIPCLHESALAVLPLRQGFGIKTKTLTCMAAGVTVVGTDRALEGIDNSEVACRANEEEAIVREVVKLLRDSKRRREIAVNARTYIEKCQNFDYWGSVYERVLSDAVEAFSTTPLRGRGAR